MQEAEVAAAGAQERERAAGERMTQAASRMAVMEAQVGLYAFAGVLGVFELERSPRLLVRGESGSEPDVGWFC